MLIPTISVNYVETLMMAKERLTKNNPYNAYFSDDGLVLGLTYFLKVLK